MTKLKQILSAIEQINKKSINSEGEYIQQWYKYREVLVNQKNELEKQADKTVFTISTGAIGVSFVILDKLTVPDNYKLVYIILAASWLVLIISIILQARSYSNTAKRIGKNITLINTVINSVSNDDLESNINSYNSKLEGDNKKINNLASIAFSSMILGIILLMVFSFISLSLKKDKKVDVSDKTSFIHNINLTIWQKV